MREDIAGMVAVSRAGRDRGRGLVAIAAEGDGYVLVADGRLRRLARPKRKKLKHLAFTGERIDLGSMPGDTGCADAFIRRELSRLGYKDNTASEEG